METCSMKRKSTIYGIQSSRGYERTSASCSRRPCKCRASALPRSPQADASANSATTAQTRRILSYLIGRCHGFDRLRSADAYPHFNAIRDGRSDHGIVATLLGRCDRVILELSLVGFLSPLARKFDTYP